MEHRVNSQIATEAALIQLAIASVIGGEKPGKEFRDQITQLSGAKTVEERLQESRPPPVPRGPVDHRVPKGKRHTPK